MGRRSCLLCRSYRPTGRGRGRIVVLDRSFWVVCCGFIFLVLFTFLSLFVSPLYLLELGKTELVFSVLVLSFAFLFPPLFPSHRMLSDISRYHILASHPSSLFASPVHPSIFCFRSYYIMLPCVSNSLLAHTTFSSSLSFLSNRLAGFILL